MGRESNVTADGFPEAWLGVLHLFAILVAMVAYAVVVMLCSGITDVSGYEQWQILTQLAGQHILILGGMTAAFVHWGRPRWRVILGPESMQWWWIPVVLLLSPSLILFEEPLLRLWSQGLGVSEPDWYQHALTIRGWGDGLLVLLAVSLLPAVFEELLFRGYVQYRFRKMGVVWAIGLQALLFALYHMDLYGLPVYLLSGLVLGWIRWLSGSLWVPVLFHALNNGLGVWDYNQGGSFLSAEAPLHAIGGLIVFVVVVWWVVRRTRGRMC